MAGVRKTWRLMVVGVVVGVGTVASCCSSPVAGERRIERFDLPLRQYPLEFRKFDYPFYAWKAEDSILVTRSPRDRLEDPHSVYLHNLRSGEITRLDALSSSLYKRESRVSWMNVSPTGKWAAFDSHGSSGNGPMDGWRFIRLSDEHVTLTVTHDFSLIRSCWDRRGEMAFGMDWAYTKDGQMHAEVYYGQPDKLRTNHRRELVTDASKFEPESSAWPLGQMKDGSFLVVSRSPTKVRLSKVRVTSPGGAQLADSWDFHVPDGGRLGDFALHLQRDLLAFVSEREDDDRASGSPVTTTSVFLCRADGTAQARLYSTKVQSTTEGLPAITALHWSPKGRQLGFVLNDTLCVLSPSKEAYGAVEHGDTVRPH